MTSGSTLETAGIGEWQLDLDTGEGSCSPQFARILGYADSGTWNIQRLLERDVHPLDRPLVTESFQSAIKGESDWDVECRIVGEGGEIRWLWIHGSGQIGDVAKLAHLHGLVQDVTDRKRRELALRESEQKYRALLASNDQGFFLCELIFDDAGKPIDYLFLETNQRFEEFTGLKQAAGKTARELVPDLEQHWVEIYGAVARTGEPVRLQEGSDALGRWWDVYTFRLGGPESRQVASFFTDITDRRRAEAERSDLARALEVERARLVRVFEKAPAAIATLRGPEHIFEIANPVYRQLVGHRQLIGKSVREAFPDVADQGFFELLDRVYSSGQAYIGRSIRIWLQPEPGAEKVERYLDFVYQPLLEADGSVSGIFAHAVDVTEHKSALEALAKAHDEMEQRVEERTAKLSAVNAELTELNRELESFTYSASHDLRAPLRGIDGFTQVLLDDYGDRLDGTALEYLERVRAAAGRIGRIIDSLLNLSNLNRSQLHQTPLDLSKKAKEIVGWLEDEEPGRQVEVSIESDIRAAGDSGMLRLVLENLLGNAWKFTRGRERARIEFGSERSGDEQRFYVRDNGAGFDMTYADKLFTPFQRLHGPDEFEGTGIGLATVQRIIHRHGGRIWAEGRPGEGASFYFTLADDPVSRE